MSLRAYADVWEHSKATHGSLLFPAAEGYRREPTTCASNFQEGQRP